MPPEYGGFFLEQAGTVPAKDGAVAGSNNTVVVVFRARLAVCSSRRIQRDVLERAARRIRDGHRLWTFLHRFVVRRRQKVRGWC